MHIIEKGSGCGGQGVPLLNDLPFAGRWLPLFLRDFRPCSLLAVVLAFLDRFGASARSGARAVP